MSYKEGCSCESCQKHEAAQAPKPPMGGLPYTVNLSEMSYQATNNAKHLQSGFDLLAQIEAEGAESVVDTLGTWGNNVSSTLYHLAEKCSLGQYLHSTLYRVWSNGPMTYALHFDDYACGECDHYVSKTYDFDHWDLICGQCGQHKGESCSCCSECGYEECECCPICEQSPSWCNCCSYCQSAECECRECADCGYTQPNCHCGGHSSSKFGSIKNVPWESRDSISFPLTQVPSMSDCDNDRIDPLQSAADFYLLGAMSDLSRAKMATFGNSANSGEWNTALGVLTAKGQVSHVGRMADQMYHDDRFMSNVRSARGMYNVLVERLDRNLLAYAISVVGGELRYHRAVKNLPSSRSQAWDAFTGIVAENGADVLFDAVDLFEDFCSGSYGGHKWAQIAQVVAERASGKMPAWLFVDRIFTLQHNGGCVLNKVTWARKNRLSWGLSHMQTLLDAHAADVTDWALLLKAASPEVSALWTSFESSLGRLARRFGGAMPEIPVSVNARRKRSRDDEPCGDCGYYSCVCGESEEY